MGNMGGGGVNLREGAVEERGERRGIKGRVYDILCSSLRCI